MISGGSWVFDKKVKGNGEVFARFRLKSQDMAKEIINRVSFEFNRLGAHGSAKRRCKQWRQRHP